METAMETVIKTKQQLVDTYAKRMGSILGQPSSVLDSIFAAPSTQTIVTPDTYELIKAPEVPASETWYPGTVTVGGFVYSELDVKLNFGNYGRYEFEAGFWGGFGGGTGTGGGPWGDGLLPKDGEEMEFEIVFGGAGASAVQLFWWRKDGPIRGGMLAVIAGLGIGGSKGTGKWTKL